MKPELYKTYNLQSYKFASDADSGNKDFDYSKEVLLQLIKRYDLGILKRTIEAFIINFLILEENKIIKMIIDYVKKQYSRGHKYDKSIVFDIFSDYSDFFDFFPEFDIKSNKLMRATKATLLLKLIYNTNINFLSIDNITSVYGKQLFVFILEKYVDKFYDNYVNKKKIITIREFLNDPDAIKEIVHFIRVRHNNDSLTLDVETLENEFNTPPSYIGSVAFNMYGYKFFFDYLLAYIDDLNIINTNKQSLYPNLFYLYHVLDFANMQMLKAYCLMSTEYALKWSESEFKNIFEDAKTYEFSENVVFYASWKQIMYLLGNSAKVNTSRLTLNSLSLNAGLLRGNASHPHYYLLKYATKKSENSIYFNDILITPIYISNANLFNASRFSFTPHQFNALYRHSSFEESDFKHILESVDYVFNVNHKNTSNKRKKIKLVLVGLGGLNMNVLNNLVEYAHYMKIFKNVQNPISSLLGIDEIEIYEPEIIDYTNIFRMPEKLLLYTAVNNIFNSSLLSTKIEYASLLIRELKDMGIKVKANVKYFTPRDFERIEKTANDKYITLYFGAVPPDARDEFGKLMQRKFIFGGHYNDNFIITNKHELYIQNDNNLTQETYGMIDLNVLYENFKSISALLFSFIRKTYDINKITDIDIKINDVKTKLRESIFERAKNGTARFVDDKVQNPYLGFPAILYTDYYLEAKQSLTELDKLTLERRIKSMNSYADAIELLKEYEDLLMGKYIYTI